MYWLKETYLGSFCSKLVGENIIAVRAKPDIDSDPERGSSWLVLLR